MNYADDFVICCKPGTSGKAREAMQRLISRIGLYVNNEKTQVVNIRAQEKFDFLGYTIGQFYGKNGVPYYGTRPSTKSLKKVLDKVHIETSRRLLVSTPERRVLEINRIITRMVRLLQPRACPAML